MKCFRFGAAEKKGNVRLFSRQRSVSGATGWPGLEAQGWIISVAYFYLLYINLTASFSCSL